MYQIIIKNIFLFVKKKQIIFLFRQGVLRSCIAEILLTTTHACLYQVMCHYIECKVKLSLTFVCLSKKHRVTRLGVLQAIAL